MKLLPLTGVIALLSTPAFAQEGQNSDAADKVVDGVIEQLEVVGTPLSASNIESATPVTVVAGEELRNKQAATLGDTLASEVGVHTSFHANVASTPVIRGLSGPRVLITQNSLDVSDVSRVGPDHSVTAEVSSAEQVEVLRGPATLFYGSGAIGGVVNVVDKRVPTDTETRGEWQVSHDSVNDQNLASFNLNTGSGNIAFHLDAFSRESNDYEVPVSPHHDEPDGDERTVANSAEDSDGFTVGASYILDNGYVGFSYGELEREHGIPGHGHGDEMVSLGLQQDRYQVISEFNLDHAFFNALNTRLGYTDYAHTEFEEGGEVSLGLQQDRYQLISELSLDHAIFNALNTRLAYTDYTHTEFEEGEEGTTFTNETSEIKLELMHQPLSGWNGAIVLDYKNSDFSAAGGHEKFAPPSETESYAIALVEERKFGDVLVQLGARAEHVNINSRDLSTDDEWHLRKRDGTELHGEIGPEKFDKDYTPLSLSIGAVWDFKPGYNIGIALSHSERAPSAAELLSFGPHIATGTFEIGALYETHVEDDETHYDPSSSKPEMEKSSNIDLTFRKFEGDIGIILNAFYNQVDNYYAEFDQELCVEVDHDHDAPSTPAPAEPLIGDCTTDEVRVFQFQSADVTLHGFEAQGIWQINSNVKTTLFADYVRAKLDDGGNLPRISPMRVGASVDYVYNRLSTNLSYTHYYSQDDVTEPEEASDGYDWIDANINYRIPLNKTELTLFVKAENLTDEEARVHSSFVKEDAPRPGRNLRIGIRGSF